MIRILPLRRAQKRVTLVGSALAAALSVSGLAVPPAGASAATLTAPVQAKPESTSLDASIAQAVATNDRVVVPDYITESSRLIANPDTSLTMEISNEPVRVKQSGTWVDVNPALVPRTDGRVGPRASVADISFSGGGTGPMVTYRSGRALLTLGAPVTSLPAPTLSKNRARYSEILPGVDLVLSATADTFRQTVVIKTATAAADPRVKTLKFASALQNATMTSTSSGGLAAVEPTGIKAFESPQAIMWDSTTSSDLSAPASTSSQTSLSSLEAVTSTTSTTDPAVEIQPTEGSKVATVPVAATSTDLTLTPNLASLGSQITYPVYVDPTFAPSRTGWTMVTTKYPTTKYWRFGGDEGMGYYSGSQGTMRKRLYYMFATGGLAGATIKRARFTAFETHANSCTASQVEVHRANDISTNTTWNTQPAASATAESVRKVAYGRADCSPAGHDVEFDVTNAVAYTTAHRLPNTTLQLRATSESSSSGWKRFTGGAVLSIDYNHAPNMPTSVSMLNPSKGCNSAFPNNDVPDLRVLPSDADRENLTVNFQISSGTTVVKTLAVTVRSGTWAVVAVPKNSDGTYLLGNKTYTWKAWATDAWRDSGPATPACAFTLQDPQVPPPSLDLVDSVGNPVSPVMTAGAQVKVVIGPGAGTDIAYYEWSVNQPSPTTQWVAGSAAPVVTLAGAGTTTIYLRSVSRAGTRSDTVSQGVQVVPVAIQERNRWRLNEAVTATQAADTPLPSAAGTVAPLTLAGTAAKFTGASNGSSAKDDPRSGSLSCSAGASVSSSAQNLVDPTKDWTLTAWVRPGAGTAEETLISEDGSVRAVFALKTRTVSVLDPFDNVTVQRRVFSLVVDNNSAAATVDSTDLVVVPGAWYKIAISFEASLNSYRLMINEAGYQPMMSVGLALAFHPTAGTTFRLCSSYSGEIDNVVNIPSLLNEEQINARLEQGQ